MGLLFSFLTPSRVPIRDFMSWPSKMSCYIDPSLTFWHLQTSFLVSQNRFWHTPIPSTLMWDNFFTFGHPKSCHLESPIENLDVPQEMMWSRHVILTPRQLDLNMPLCVTSVMSKCKIDPCHDRDDHYVTSLYSVCMSAFIMSTTSYGSVITCSHMLLYIRP